jgi:voltage-gated potassium channel
MFALTLAALVASCTAIHAFGMWLGVRALAASRGWKGLPTLGSAITTLALAACLLTGLHLLHILLWALFYQHHDLLPNFETAIYFSATSYATLGYGDVTLSENWRLLGPLEAVTGVLFFGWSTGALFLLASRTLGPFLRISSGPP